MNQGMRPGLEAYENERDDGQHDLQTLGALLLCAALSPPPLRCRAIAKVSDPGDHREVHESTDRGRDQHGNADGVLMPALRGCVNPADGGQRRKADRDSHAANGKNGSAKALQEGQQDAGPANRPNLLRIDRRSGRSLAVRSSGFFFELQWATFERKWHDVSTRDRH